MLYSPFVLLEEEGAGVPYFSLSSCCNCALLIRSTSQVFDDGGATRAVRFFSEWEAGSPTVRFFFCVPARIL